jgi:hypothetical protein
MPTHETELDSMAEYKVTRDGGDKDDGLPGWMHREVRDHDRHYEATGIFSSTVRGVGLSVRSVADNH